MTALGDCLRNLRNLQGFTQREVAMKGVLTQGQLSKIEKGTIRPDVDKLDYLSKCYGVTLDYFQPYLEEGKYLLDSNQGQHIEETRLAIRKILQYQKYTELKEILEQEKERPWVKSPLHTPYFLWITGIVEMECHKNPQKALNFFNQALTNHTHPALREQSAEIHNSKGIYYLLQKQPKKARELFTKGLKQIQQLTKIRTPEIKIRLLYNLSICDYQLQDYKSSIQCSKQALKIVEDHASYYLHAELLYQCGLSCYFGKRQEEARDKMKKAQVLFKFQRQEEHYQHVTKKLKELKLD